MDEILHIGVDCVPRHISLGEGENLRLTLYALPGDSADVELRIDLCGEGASADIAGLYICPSDELLNIKVDLRHLVPGCTSRQLFKGTAGGSARFCFDGRIFVEKGAGRTKAYQENHNLLLSEGARAETRPQLEIYADDVECSHGATVGRLDETQLYYMRSRGIPETEARRFQILSFLSPVLTRLPGELAEKIADTI